VDLLIVVSTELLFLLIAPATQRLLDITGSIFATDHEANLTTRVGRDGGVGVLDDGENLLAGLLKASD
jgi:hypothetical protein